MKEQYNFTIVFYPGRTQTFELIQEPCENKREFNKKAKAFYDDLRDFQEMAVYVFSQRGFVRKNWYTRGEKNWELIK